MTDCQSTHWASCWRVHPACAEARKQPPKPYIVRPVEAGKAHVVDRTTGTLVGWVVSDYYGHWDAYTTLPGVERLGWRRYRAAAAAAVWEATR